MVLKKYCFFFKDFSQKSPIFQMVLKRFGFFKDLFPKISNIQFSKCFKKTWHFPNVLKRLGVFQMFFKKTWCFPNVLKTWHFPNVFQKDLVFFKCFFKKIW